MTDEFTSESLSDTEQTVANHASKRLRQNDYHPPDAEVAPISRKRRAAIHGPDEEDEKESPIGQLNSGSQIFPRKRAKHSKTNVGSVDVSSPQDEVAFVQTPPVPEADNQETDEDYESEGEDGDEPANDHDDEGPSDDSDDSRVPTTPPAEAFTVQPPAKLLSWKKGQYAPTKSYINQQDCPVNWEYVKARTSGLTDAHIQAYIYRKPWVPNDGESEYDTIKRMFNKAGDTSVKSLEGVRKRFGKANRAVFETTSVWFEGSTPGLESHGIKGRTKAEFQQEQASQNTPTQDEADDEDGPAAPLPVKIELDPDDQIITFILQPPDLELDDRCVECCKAELCYDKKCREAWRQFHTNPQLDNSSDSEDSDSEDDAEDDEPYHLGKHSSDRYGKALSKQRTPFGCHMHQPLIMRFVHREKFAAVRTSEKGLESEYVVDVSPKSFDLFTSCFAPNFSGEFPERPKRLEVYLDREDADQGKDFSKAVYEDVGEYNIGNILEAYCCSQSLNCPIVSDVLLDHLRKILLNRESFTLFEPEDLRYVFHFTNASDPIRLFLLDAFRLKMAPAKRLMRQHCHSYPPELVRYWAHWERQQLDEISPENQQLIDEFPTTYMGRRGAINGLLGRIRVIPEPEEHPHDREGVIWDNCIFEGWSTRTWKPPAGRLSRDALHERFSQTDSIDALSSNNDRLFRETYYNLPIGSS
ncbi:uncharacterized protein N0V89_000494 [Didymosphaeria variabile]|uniref:Uncharacterized protein n=1 Tax=Didymosphaeria variabile TaxID=1932322 RepID=A0A9W8XW83_9PLEO|nr:uncharacterized protein N0V89_000494 [Didymosphaeria variabile]KAJ4359935.1 hypothetical protein N0V89_000494 [Didymosphaeria variabile]